MEYYDLIIITEVSKVYQAKNTNDGSMRCSTAICVHIVVFRLSD